MAAAVAATSWGSPGKEDGQIIKIHAGSPTSVLFWDTVVAQEQTTKLRNTIQYSVDDEDWDPELATGSSLTEFPVGEVLDDAKRSKIFEAFERSDENVPWDEWIPGPVATAEAATLQDINSWHVSNIIPEVTVGKQRTVIRDGMVVCERENGEIKKRRYAKHGDGTRRHGRPPDLTLGRPFGHSESWNMGVYPGRGPALISRADMIISPPPATTTLCPPGADEGVAGPVDVLKDLPRNHLFALSGLSAAGNASPPIAKSGIPKSSELSVSNPANLSP